MIEFQTAHPLIYNGAVVTIFSVYPSLYSDLFFPFYSIDFLKQKNYGPSAVSFSFPQIILMCSRGHLDFAEKLAKMYSIWSIEHFFFYRIVDIWVWQMQTQIRLRTTANNLLQCTLSQCWKQNLLAFQWSSWSIYKRSSLRNVSNISMISL